MIDKAQIEGLQSQIDGKVFQAGDDGYDEARLIWNGMFDKRPALAVRCDNAQDVSAAVSFAREHSLPLAVRGGGHNSSGSGACDDGVMIDLSAMKSVEVNPSARRAKVGGGATWKDFDSATQAHGLATPGGVVSATGVGGLTLAGGIGWLRGKHGLSLDNLLGVEIVNADGEIRRANAEENSELFWGVRGGGGNFGVITEFEFQLHPIGPTVFLLAPIYRAEDAAKVMRGWRDYMDSAPDEIAGSMVEFATIPEDPEYPEEAWNQRVMTLAGVWNGPADEGEQVLQPLRELAEPLLDFSGQMEYCEVQTMYDALFPMGVHRTYFKSVYLNGFTDEMIAEIAPRAADRPSDMSLCSVWYMGGAVAKVPADATAFGARDMGWMLSIDCIWEDAGEDATNLGWARKFWADMKHHSDGRAYLNFAGLGEEGEKLVRTSYGTSNYDRLVALKDQYDPGNLFRLNQNVKPSDG